MSKSRIQQRRLLISPRRRCRMLLLLWFFPLLVLFLLFIFTAATWGSSEVPESDGKLQMQLLQMQLLQMQLLQNQTQSHVQFSPAFSDVANSTTGPASGLFPPSSLPCATVEEMGEIFSSRRKSSLMSLSPSDMESLRVRELIQRHFHLHGADNVRQLPPHKFCRQGFVLGKASEAGFGNEMYRILTAAALSVMLNRSLIIGQTREKFPFENYISYANFSFTLNEVKHLWRKNKCIKNYGRDLVIRIDDFEKPSETNVLCSDWTSWKHPIIWFQGTTDAVGIQFFLKNIHPTMRNAAASLFGQTSSLRLRANVFGELMRVILSPSPAVKQIVNWALNGSSDPDMALHMRMMMNRPVRAKVAALNCVMKASQHHQHKFTRPRIVLVSDTPLFVNVIMPDLTKFSDVIHFDYNAFVGTIPGENITQQPKLDFRVKDWGPAPRWVAFVDFFLAARAKYSVISGAHRRVGTTYAQLVAALAAANQLGTLDSSASSSFTFFSSFQSNLLAGGLASQVGWGHVWNRFSGPLSCRHQPHQCAYTPLLPPAWWDDDWQSPISRDVRRLQEYGVQLTDTGKVVESNLYSFCKTKRKSVKIIPIIRKCKDTKCL